MPSSFQVVCCAVVLSSTLYGRASAADKTLEHNIGRLAQPYIDANRVVGISIGVLKAGQAITAHVGHTRSQGPVPDNDTVYEIGSVSKVFTGILVADAVVRGRARLDQPAQELLPGNVKMPRWKDRPIMIVDLTTHRSGLPRLASNMPIANGQNPYVDYTSKLAYEFLTEHRLRRRPGSEYEYSNLGMALAGYLISANAELSYDELLRQRIAEPLAMKSTRVVLSPSMHQRLATPHLAVGEETSTWECADMPGAAGIRSSTTDMLRFAQAHLSPPNDDTGRAIELAWKKHTVDVSKGPAMGLGWNFAGDGKTRWHNGQTGGSHSMLLINRETQMAVVLLANTASQELDRLAFDVVRMLRGAEVKPRSFEEPIRVAKKVMERYVGQYQLAPSFVFAVSVKGDKLMVGITKQPTVQVFARSETEWFYTVVDATLKFQIDNDGKCTSLQLIQNGITQTAKRIK